jgi:REP element-mobilizing transposase RayT
VLRGNHRENLFSNERDREVLNTFVVEAVERYRARIHVFCWMTNHLHALIQIADAPLGLLVKRFAMRYSRYRHKQLRTTGHLFERRYKAWLVDTDTYFVSLLRYIHCNPVEAKMVACADDYPWSSHRAYLGLEQLPWLTSDFGLSLMGKTIETARRHYRALIDGVCSDIGELSALLASDDPRVLGTDRFLASLPPPRIKPRSGISLDELVDLICIQRGISRQQLTSASKQRYLADARAELARRAVDERVASLNAVAQLVNRTSAAISQLLARRDTEDV